MSPPPTSIDGTDITGATIDGQDVKEITIDGQVVFTAIPDSGVARYNFEDDSDTTTATDTFNNNDGTINGPTYTTDAQVGDFALDFTSGNVDISIIDSFITSPVSVAAWAKADSTDGFVFDHGSTRFVIGFNVQDSNGLEFTIFDGSSYSTISSGDNATGVYYHMVAVFDASVTPEMEFYVDGSSVGTNTVSQIGSGKQQTVIGSKTDNAGATDFDGRIDDVKIYDKALSDAEVSNLFSSESIF